MRAFTYYDPVPALTPVDETKLILLWMENWRTFGFEPVVLNAWHALDHPLGPQFRDAVAKLPSVNPAGYDLACYLRWMAMANALEVGELGLMLDYDVFNYGLAADAIPNKRRFSILDRNGVPGAVVGLAEDFLAQAMRFHDYRVHPDDTVNGQPHTSDMMILSRQHQEHPGLITLHDVIREYTDPGWEKATLVHYSNQKTADKRPRWQHIPALR